MPMAVDSVVVPSTAPLSAANERKEHNVLTHRLDYTVHTPSCIPFSPCDTLKNNRCAWSLTDSSPGDSVGQPLQLNSCVWKCLIWRCNNDPSDERSTPR